jgi:predicted amidohydrolase YtcJ
MLRSVAVLVCLLIAYPVGPLVQGPQPPADLVLLDGKVLTVDAKFTEARAFAVRGGRFVKVGSTEEIRAYVGSSTRVIEGRGRTVIPGLIDTHVHSLGVAAEEASQPFKTLRSIGELQQWVRTEAGRRPAGTWIWTPRTYPPRLREHRFPTRAELDAAAPAHPVAVDGAYALSLNTAALKAAGITRDTPDPQGGAIVKDAAGEPTGLLRNVGGMLSRFHAEAAAVPPLDLLERVHQQYIATGITSVIERGASLDGYRTYEALQRAGRLKVRSTVTIRIPRANDATEVERWVTALPVRFGSGDEWLKVGPLKIVADGGILIGTAYMREPYGPGARQLYAIDDPHYRGFLTLTPEQIKAAVAIGHRHGWQIVTHVTGDAGVDAVLDAYEAALKEPPSSDRRHTIIHGYFVHPETAARAARLGVLVDTQPAWYYKDASALAAALGKNRLAHFIGLRTLRQAGVDVAINTDHMYGLDRDDALNPFNPFLTIYAASTRRTESGEVIGADESVSRQEALRMMTSAAAKFSFDEKDRGSIEAGKLADFAVLDTDLLSCTPEQLRAIRPDLTVIGGRVAFERTGTAVQGRALVLDNVRVIDGTGAAPIEKGRIVVEGARISKIGPAATVGAPPGAETLDLSGRTIIPGLIDLHFHIESDPKLALRQLSHGITAFRDPGQWNDKFVELRKMISVDRLPGPRIFTTGPHIDGEHPAYPADSVVARDPEDARRLAERNVQEGATALKIYFRLPFTSARSVIGVCDAHHIPCTAHLEILDARELIDAGLQGIEHITSFGTSVLPRREAEAYRQAVLASNEARRNGRYETFARVDLDGPEAQALYAVLRVRKPWIDPTLAVFERRADQADKDVTPAMAKTMAEGFAKMKQLTRRVGLEGGRLVMGGHSDVPFAARGEAPWRELELLVESGLSPVDAITAATGTAAGFLYKSEEFGTLRPGMKADLAVLRGDVSRDIAAIRTVDRVMVNGEWIDCARYRAY